MNWTLRRRVIELKEAAIERQFWIFRNLFLNLTDCACLVMAENIVEFAVHRELCDRDRINRLEKMIRRGI